MIDLLVCEDLEPSEVILMWEKDEMLSKCLSVLTERQREVVIYFYIEKFSIGKIANRLNISYRTVVNTKTKAIKKLQNELINNSL